MSSQLFVRMTPKTVEPVAEAPAPGTVLAGDPKWTTWSVEETDGILSGLWESTPGKWSMNYTEWEYCRILSGRSKITEDGGAEHIVQAGDSFLLRRGFKGTWEVLETTRKDYVIIP